MSDLIKRFVMEEEGATMVEYALMVALIAVVCILVVGAIGTAVWGVFDSTQQELNTVSVTPTDPTATP